jgi:hypothetical protein
MTGATRDASVALDAEPDAGWEIVGVGDFDGTAVPTSSGDMRPTGPTAFCS